MSREREEARGGAVGLGVCKADVGPRRTDHWPGYSVCLVAFSSARVNVVPRSDGLGGQSYPADTESFGTSCQNRGLPIQVTGSDG